MAKIYNTFSSSPILGSSYLEDYSLIRPDPSELFEDLMGGWGSTIWGDIQKMDSGNDLPISGAPDYGAVKTEIRNSDCMWSGQSQTELSTSASSTGSDLAVTRAVPLAAVTAKPAQLPAPTVVVANNNKSKMQQAILMSQPQQYVEIKTEIKVEPTDDYENQLQQHSIPNVRNTNTTTVIAATTSSTTQPQQLQQSSSSSVQSMQHIPPGTSLLRKSNAPQQQIQQQQRKLQKHQQLQQKLSTLHLTCNSNNNNASKSGGQQSNSVVAAFDTMTYELPDTPPSLDDEATDFKQTNIDLRACMMGSNNISLNAGIIDNISKELQDTSKDKINTRLTSDHPDIHEVLDVIMRDENKSMYTSKMNTISDCESDEDEESTANSGYGSASSILDGELSYGRTSPVSSQASSQTSMSHHATQAHCHSDHSYTRCKEGIDDLSNSAYTPSDSDEEIDVVSVSDKKLPTNPSDRDRRAIEHKVGYRFSTARIVKNPNGIRTIPPRRRGSYTLPYTPASSSPVKSVSTSRYPSPSSTPYHSGNTTTYANKFMLQQQANTLSTDANNGHCHIITSSADKSRKRLTMNSSANSSADVSRDLDYTLPPSKKHRGKKSSKHGHHSSSISSASSTQSGANAADAVRRHFSLDESADTIEKRNLHNDMERQRRIGLKNLFEELKKQIPSIKDKERAPKVNILREAAKLCESLTRENQQLCDTKEVLREQMRKRQEHLARLRSLLRD
ncbi:PREDICTED: myc protein-like [Rhagoletis zephyria]|uniref:myc protein-like n=1 Tax=Rhagoletis zephyria TaxID=28612 RepID=UPI0008114245|nr:PREDICTED: myc protein-like [Rhagoletis zephyria]